MGRRAALVGSAGLVLAAVHGCLSPTQISVEIVTDVPCAEVNGVAAWVGAPGIELAAAPPKLSADHPCDTGRIGSFVVTPSGGKSDEVGIEVALGIDGGVASACSPPRPGCIVARRVVSFTPRGDVQV